MALDATGIELIIVIGLAVGFFSALLSNSMGKIIAILAALPLILFLGTAIVSGMNVHNPRDLGEWLTPFVNGVVPLLISSAVEGVGAGFGATARTRLNW